MIQARQKRREGNASLRQLRTIVGRTQAEFAALVGVSTDTVISWENGRNRLSAAKARSIHMATGARATELLEGKGQVRNMSGAPFSAEDFQNWHDTYLEATDAVRAEYFAKEGSIFLWLLFQAAAKPGPGKLKNRLPAIWISFLEWAEETADNCRLRPEIKAVQNKHRQELKEKSAEAQAILARRAQIVEDQAHIEPAGTG
jgi:transcriptional regulator with XRE-family HTH domain